MAVGTRCADHVTPFYPQKLALTSPTGGGRSVGIVRLWTKATEFSFLRHATRMDSTGMAEIMLNCRPNGRRWLGRSLDEGVTGLSRPNVWLMIMMIMMMIVWMTWKEQLDKWKKQMSEWLSPEPGLCNIPLFPSRTLKGCFWRTMQMYGVVTFFWVLQDEAHHRWKNHRV